MHKHLSPVFKEPVLDMRERETAVAEPVSPRRLNLGGGLLNRSLFIHKLPKFKRAPRTDLRVSPAYTALALATDGHLTLRVRGGSECNISCGYIRPHLDGPKDKFKFPRVIFKLDPVGNRGELWPRTAGLVGLDDLILVFPGGAASLLRCLTVNGDH